MVIMIMIMIIMTLVVIDYFFSSLTLLSTSRSLLNY